MNPVPKREKDHIIRAYNDRVSIEEIAEHFGRSEQAIRSLLSVWGACNRIRKTTLEERAAILELARLGIEDEVIAKAFKKSRSTIRHLRNFHGLKKKPWSRRTEALT